MQQIKYYSIAINHRSNYFVRLNTTWFNLLAAPCYVFMVDLIWYFMRVQLLAKKSWLLYYFCSQINMGMGILVPAFVWWRLKKMPFFEHSIFWIFKYLKWGASTARGKLQWQPWLLISVCDNENKKEQKQKTTKELATLFSKENDLMW